MWVGLRISGIELMKAVNVWRIEESLVRRVLSDERSDAQPARRSTEKHKE